MLVLTFALALARTLVAARVYQAVTRHRRPDDAKRQSLECTRDPKCAPHRHMLRNAATSYGTHELC